MCHYKIICACAAANYRMALAETKSTTQRWKIVAFARLRQTSA
jgi:hypothetical protein